MDANPAFPSSAVTAVYTPQRIPQYRGNPLIEALPVTLDDDALIDWLTLSPDFEPEQRDWPTHERIHMLKSLRNFMVPMSRHIELARALDAMIRGGYVGRAPRTPEHVRIAQRIYENQKAGVPFRQTAQSVPSQCSTSLVGISGLGKTTAVRRILAAYPQALYHPDLHLYQVPYLHIEMPSDGASVKGLAAGALHKMDQLIPGANYCDLYLARGRTSADTLMRHTASVLHRHAVGLLVADETQNLANAPKGSQVVMSELVSACNELGLPILFIGTPKARNLLSLDLRQARRASGEGVSYWDRLPEFDESGEPGEWAGFLEVLFAYQWVRNPHPLDAQMASLMYAYSQGVVDIAIKLFAAAQARAMLDGSEELSGQLLLRVFNEELSLLHPMVEALRTNDLEALARYGDIAPPNLETMLDGAAMRYRGKRLRAVSVGPAQETFTPRLATSLVALGVDESDAQALAEKAAADGSVANLVDGAEKALAALKAPKLVKAKRAAKAPAQPTEDIGKLDGLRRCIAEAQRQGTTILEQLRGRGEVPNLLEVLPPD